MSAPTAQEGPASDLGWMSLQIQALYRCDPRGRLVACNTPLAKAGGEDDPAPPRLFIGITREGLSWRMRADLDGPLVAELSRLLGAERPPADLDREPERMAVVRARLERDAAIEQTWMGPAFRFPERLPDGGDTLLLGAEDEPKVAHLPGLRGRLAVRGPVCAVLREGQVVSVAYCATRPGGPGSAVEAGVETLPGFRGCGHAQRAVAAWARAIRAGGSIPLYSTSLDNRASLGVARGLGLIRYGTDLHLR